MSSISATYLQIKSLFRGDSLKARAVRSSSWAFFGHGAQQVLRLSSNMIMTRLLFPEAFGLMSLAFVFIAGLQMFSDIGLRASIVQSHRGEEIRFLNTAWTIQVLRGFLLWIIVCAIAYPASLLYEKPQLFPVLCVVGLTAAIQGFQTTGYASSDRNLRLGMLTVVDLISQVIGLLTMVIWAYLAPTIWALVAGAMVTSAVNVLLAHKTLNTHRHRFTLDRTAVSEIIRFGKWIFLATASTYLAGEGLRLIQGTLVPLATIGIISIAANIALAFKNLTGRISSSVLFPVFSETYRVRPAELKQQLLKSRRYLFLLTLPFFIFLIVLGKPIVALLYDPRYHEAGLYLSIMSVGAALSVMKDSFGMALLAIGDSASHTLNISSLAILRVAGVVIGFYAGGVIGMLVADVIAEICVYPIEAWRLKKHGLWFPKFDIAVFVFYIGLGLAVCMIHAGH